MVGVRRILLENIFVFIKHFYKVRNYFLLKLRLGYRYNCYLYIHQKTTQPTFLEQDSVVCKLKVCFILFKMTMNTKLQL